MDNKLLDFIDLFDCYNEHNIAKPFTIEVIEKVGA
jgi:hypothetical protein